MVATRCPIAPCSIRLAQVLMLGIGLASTPRLLAQSQPEGRTSTGAVEQVVVTGRAEEFYRVGETTFATKTPTDVLNVPQSVQVLTAQLIEDQAARDTTELYRSISGVTFFSYSGVTFRGFRQDEIRYDGVRGDPFAGFSVPQLFNIERVEVLKGVSGMLYGGGQPGGVINYVTKKPEFDEASTVLEATAGNRSLLGVSADATRPLAWAGGDRFAYRVGAFYEEQDDFRNNAGNETAIVNGSLSWRPGSATEVTGRLSRYEIDLSGNRLRGVPVDDAGHFLTDIGWNTNEASDFLRLDALIGQLEVSHEFEGGATANVKVRYIDNEERQQYHESRGPAAPGSTLYLREFRDQRRTNEELSLTADFVLERELASTRHTLLFGTEAFRQQGTFAGRTAGQLNPLEPSASLGPVPPLDLLEPRYGRSGIDFLRDDLAQIEFRRSGSDVDRYGFYAQDQVALNDRWHVVAGARYDSYEDRDPVSGTSTSDESLSLRGGVIFKPADTVSMYASYGEGFVPQGVLDPADGGPFGPEMSEQLELGAKTELFDGRIFAGFAVYRIVKDDVLVGNPDPDAGVGGVPNLLQIGEVTSEGLEADFVGDLTDLWTFQANYAYNDSRITRGGPGSIGLAVGDRFPNAPEHAFGFWTRRELPALGSAIAGGIDYVGDRLSIDGQAVRSYLTADVSWITELDPWKLQINIRNLLDEEYAASGFIARTGHFPGEPRTVVTQISRRF